MSTVQAGQNGLTSAEAQRRLAAKGYNEVAATQPRLVWVFVHKLWAPVPWMLEVTIALTLALGHVVDAGIIAFLLVFNAGISFFQERRADTALQLLQERLNVTTRVLRDGHWQQLPARELVQGDVLHLRMGDIVPADVRVFTGVLLLDQSPLTGESVPVERGSGATAYAGALVKHGEASGTVIATGVRSFFGRTAALVKTAQTASHLEALVLTIVEYLVVIDTILVLAVVGVALFWLHLGLSATLPFALMLLVASVPVALPATFTLTQALGAQELAQQGVLITRLPAIEEAASMDVLCTDKTGTITQNQLRVGRVIAYPPTTNTTVLHLGALASDAASQDPLDVAILAAAVAASTDATLTSARRFHFTPFDPARKRTEAHVERQDGTVLTIVKGAPHVVAALTSAVPAVDPPILARDVAVLASEGYRVLAVASGPEGALRLAGLIGLADPPRADSAPLIRRLRELGVRPLMLTGDTVETARAMAQVVGIGTRVGDADALRALRARHTAGTDIARAYDAIAGIFPEDKFHLVQALQAAGHVVGMTGDGVNDAPALKQAEVGVAVATATDVAKAAASIVLTTPGLLNVLAAVDTSRRIYRRMQTYTLNKIVKTIQVAGFLAGAFLVTQHFVITPHLIVLLLFANDFVTMSIATDKVTPSPSPEHWQLPHLFAMAGALAVVLLVEAGTILWLSTGPWRLSPAQVPTVIFLMLVFSGQTTIYVVRERGLLWRSMPSRIMLVASSMDILVVSLLAATGVLMAAVHLSIVLLVLALALLFMLLLDATKVLLYRLLPQVSQTTAGR